MPELLIPVDCGNAPKKLFLKELYISVAEGDLSPLTDAITDDITWNIVGSKTVTGNEAFREELTAYIPSPVNKLIIHDIITHGREAAVHGEWYGDEDTTISFCDVYSFKSGGSTAIKSIHTYAVAL